MHGFARTDNQGQDYVEDTINIWKEVVMQCEVWVHKYSAWRAEGYCVHFNMAVALISLTNVIGIEKRSMIGNGK